MAKKVEVSYNPQLGYLATVFKHDFDFLTGVRSYEVRDCGVTFEAETYHKNRAVVTIDLVGANAVRFQMFPYGNTECFRNEVFSLAGQEPVTVSETEEFICIGGHRLEVRVIFSYDHLHGPFDQIQTLPQIIHRRLGHFRGELS